MKPKNGLTTEAKVIKIHDADTIYLEVTRQFPVRLLDTDHKGQFNSPELNTVEGQKATEFVKQILPEGVKVTLFVPAGKNELQLTDINSFNRILGEIWIGEDKLTDILIEAGHGQIK